MRNLFKTLILIFMSVSAFGQATSYICAGASKTLEVTASGGVAPITYTWTSPSSVTTTGATVSASVGGTWNWTAEDANGCTANGTHQVIIEANPTAGITINANNTCAGQNQTISATGIPAGYTYSWVFGTQAVPATSTAASASVSYSTSGSKTISLTISRTINGSGGGCNATCEWSKNTSITIGQLSGSSSCN